MPLLDRLTRLESKRPKSCVLGFVVICEQKRVLGIASIGAPHEGLERWARTGQPENTRAVLFSCEPSERLQNVVPVEALHAVALEAAERVARAAPTPYS